MSPNRKAELQRKLSLAPIPKPPAGLADRIKNEIPKKLYIDTELERRRLSQQVAFNMRVAAAILLLIGSSFLALHLLSRYRSDATSAPTAPVATANNLPQGVEVHIPAKADTIASVPERVQSVARAAPAPPPKLAEAQSLKKKEATRERDEEGAADTKAAPITLTMQAPVASPAAAPAPVALPPPASADAAAPAAGRVEGGVEAREMARKPQAQSGYLDLTKTAEAAEMKYEPAKVLFSVDLTTPLQHFAAPSTLPRRGLRLEADAAPAPLDDAKNIVRISLDTAPLSGGKDSTAVPLALDATLDVAFDPDAVIAHRSLAGELSAKERMIVEGTSSTALFEVELKPSLDRHATIATVRLHFRATSDGKEQTIEKVIRAGDVARSWNRASLRTKRASLAAALAEGADRNAIAEKARAAGFTDLADEAKKP